MKPWLTLLLLASTTSVIAQVKVPDHKTDTTAKHQITWPKYTPPDPSTYSFLGISSKELAKQNAVALLSSLEANLDKNSIPDFLLDPCLDRHNISYCYVNSHQEISLRYDLINALSSLHLWKLYELSLNIPCLDGICSIQEELPYEMCSTKDVINVLYNKKVLHKKVPIPCEQKR